MREARRLPPACDAEKEFHNGVTTTKTRAGIGMAGDQDDPAVWK
jgi:hypothetical protein